MKPLSTSARQGMIRAVYLSPAIVGTLLLIYSFIPHLFFVYGDAAYNTLSPFGLMGNTWTECQALFDAAEASVGAVSFSLMMSAAVVLSWICAILYAVMAAVSAICSCAAFSYRPTAKEANRAKRWMQFFCMNRVIYVIGLLLPILPAAFPHILLSCYQKQLHYNMSLHFMGPSDLLLAAILCTLNAAVFLCLLRAQNEEHMDMFRLYKAK